MKTSLIVLNGFSYCLLTCGQGPGEERVANTVLHSVLTSSCLQLYENPVKAYLRVLGAGQPF